MRTSQSIVTCVPRVEMNGKLVEATADAFAAEVASRLVNPDGGHQPGRSIRGSITRRPIRRSS